MPSPDDLNKLRAALGSAASGKSNLQLLWIHQQFAAIGELALVAARGQRDRATLAAQRREIVTGLEKTLTAAVIASYLEAIEQTAERLVGREQAAARLAMASPAHPTVQ